MSRREPLCDEVDVLGEPAAGEQGACERCAAEEDHLVGGVGAERGEEVGDQVIAGYLAGCGTELCGDGLGFGGVKHVRVVP